MRVHVNFTDVVQCYTSSEALLILICEKTYLIHIHNNWIFVPSDRKRFGFLVSILISILNIDS